MKMTADIREAIAKDVIFFDPLFDDTEDITLKRLAEKYKVGKSTIQRDKKVYYNKWKSTGRKNLEEYAHLRMIDMQDKQKAIKHFCITEDEKMCQFKILAHCAQKIVDAEKRWDTFLHPPQSKVEPDKA